MHKIAMLNRLNFNKNSDITISTNNCSSLNAISSGEFIAIEQTPLFGVLPSVIHYSAKSTEAKQINSYQTILHIDINEN